MIQGVWHHVGTQRHRRADTHCGQHGQAGGGGRLHRSSIAERAADQRYVQAQRAQRCRQPDRGNGQRPEGGSQRQSVQALGGSPGADAPAPQDVHGPHRGGGEGEANPCRAGPPLHVGQQDHPGGGQPDHDQAPSLAMAPRGHRDGTAELNGHRGTQRKSVDGQVEGQVHDGQSDPEDGQLLAL